VSFTVMVGFDEAEHRYYVLSSDIPGLRVETDTFEEFIEVTKDFVPDLVGGHATGAKIEFTREVGLLRADGCEFVKPGKGSHELWRSPRTGKRFTVPRNTVKRHTANGILKETGLPKAF
jgi:predicted RNA binding protein YcfA (HicA-like mRNA interferase family)